MEKAKIMRGRGKKLVCTKAQKVYVSCRRQWVAAIVTNHVVSCDVTKSVCVL